MAGLLMWGAFEEAGQADDDQPTGAGGAGGGKLVRLVAMEGGNGGRKACDASALRTVLQRETRRERFLEPLEPGSLCPPHRGWPFPWASATPSSSPSRRSNSS